MMQKLFAAFGLSMALIFGGATMVPAADVVNGVAGGSQGGLSAIGGIGLLEVLQKYASAEGQARLQQLHAWLMEQYPNRQAVAMVTFDGAPAPCFFSQTAALRGFAPREFGALFFGQGLNGGGDSR